MPRRSSWNWLSLALGCSLSSACTTEGFNGERADGLAGEAAVDSRGADDTLDVAAWNVEWLGSPTFGPDDEPLQLANIEDVIRGTDFDVWSLEEVVSRETFEALVDSLPGYEGVLANDTIVEGGGGSYSASEQKPALLFKSDLAELVSARIILPEKSFEFGSRPPLEVRLSVTLGGATEDRIYILLHMKAFGDAESRERRTQASAALKAFLDETYPTEKVTVLGDWNDDLDGTSPFANFVRDSDYSFPTRALTDDGVGTTCSSSNTIDHQMVTDELADDRVSGTVEAYELEEQVIDYCDTTSDHKPVLVRYRFGDGATPTTGSVVINEILANEPGSDTGAEFVELVNTGDDAADLSGWTLRDGTGVRHTFADGTSLGAGQAIAVFAEAGAIPDGIDAVAASGGTLSLTNAGERVSIRDGAGATIDAFSYGASLTGADGVSMNRSPDASEGSFVLHTSLSSLESSPGLRADGSAF